MIELKKQHAALTAEREILENSIPQLETAWKNAPRNFNQYGNEIGTPESRAAMDRVSDAECRIRSIASEMSGIERKLEYAERLSLVKKTRVSSTKIMAESVSTVEALERTQARLRERFQSIEAESERSLEQAQQAERDAASLYARSLAESDDKGAATANSEIQKAAQQLAVTDEQVRQQELILTAIQIELDTIATQITAAQQQGVEARAAVLNAIGLEQGEEWNAAVKQLAAIGARILAVSYQKGGMGDDLSQLDVPRFGPGVLSLDRSALAAVARDISLADLLAA